MASGVSGGITRPVERMFEVGLRHKKEDFLFLIDAYFVFD